MFSVAKKRARGYEFEGYQVPDFSPEGLPAFHRFAATRAIGDVWAEFGVHMGNSAKTWLAALPERGVLHLFDSLKGIPEDWHLADNWVSPKGQWSSNGKITVRDRAACWHVGWFEDTLPFNFVESLGLTFIDSDLYSSCNTVLTHIDPYLGDGSVVIFDQLINADGSNYQNWREHEYRAYRESNIADQVEWIARCRYSMAGIVRR